MDAFFGLLVIAVIVAIVWRIARSNLRGDQPRAAGAKPAEGRVEGRAEPPAIASDAPPQAASATASSDSSVPALPAASSTADGAAPSLADLAAAMSDFYDQSAHPLDLEGNAHFRAGVARMADLAMPLDQVVNFAVGANSQLAAMAGAALAQRDDSAPATQRALGALRFARVWTVFYLLRFLVARADRPVVGAALIEAPDWWPDNPLMPTFLSEFIDARVAGGEAIALDAALESNPGKPLRELEALLAKLTTERVVTLNQQLHAWQSTRVDHAYLVTIGRLWRDDPAAPALIKTELLTAAALSVIEAMRKPAPGSLLIVGEPGVGKTSLFRLIGTLLISEGWTVFEASASDVLAGQVYVGELEQRMQRLLRELDVGRRVVWYQPNFHEFFYAGRHRYSPNGVLDLVMPAIEAGRLCVIGETQPGALERVLQQRPRLRVAFKSLNLDPATTEETAALTAHWLEREARALSIAPGLAAEALEIARHYLTDRALPGSVLDLLGNTRTRLAASGAVTMTRDDLLATLTELTGLPRRVVDDRAGLDPASLREHFAARVMGQPVAVQCLIDRIAMLKAGLTDPHRPIGVFLFAGPTGTGKTEVAKSLAEFLFGSVDRMIRLDMSEFQESHSLARIVGDAGEQSEMNALVNRIRKQPFAVVLLDEFEKAHPRVWDLFLQVFDDGRLSDAQGNLADFRHSIIILTSNVGATEHRGSSLGFMQGEGAYSEAQVTRAIGTTFRPEFINRLDRVVVFRPLSRAVMRDILKKELRNVLQRRGFRSREWAVEWEDSAIEFLLDRGFTPDMGARPLRRAIEEHVLAPIAMTIVENRFPEGDQFLFVKSNGPSIQVEFVDPDATEQSLVSAPAADTAATTVPLARLILTPRGAEDEKVQLDAEVAALLERVEGGQWTNEKQALLQQINGLGFWESAGRFQVVDRMERMDRIEAGADTARSLLRRLDQPGAQRTRVPGSVVSNLAQQMYLLKAALADFDAGVPADVYLAVEPVGSSEQGADRDAAWARTLLHMYEGWARKRRMRASLLGDGKDAADSAWLILSIAGFGAHQILARERGLHVLEVPESDAGFDRSTARVRVVAQPVEPHPNRAERDHAIACLQAAGSGANTVVRRYRERPSPLVRDAQGGWRTGRIGQVLGGDFDLLG